MSIPKGLNFKDYNSSPSIKETTENVQNNKVLEYKSSITFRLTSLGVISPKFLTIFKPLETMEYLAIEKKMRFAANDEVFSLLNKLKDRTKGDLFFHSVIPIFTIGIFDRILKSLIPIYGITARVGLRRWTFKYGLPLFLFYNYSLRPRLEQRFDLVSSIYHECSKSIGIEMEDDIDFSKLIM